LALAAGKPIAAIEGLAQRRVQVSNSLVAWAKGAGGDMNKKPLFAMGTALTAVILAGHPNLVCAASAVVSFQEDVFPIFKGRCIECHQPAGQGYEKSGLDLTTYEGLMKGTKYGSVVEPGNPDTSNLIWLLDWKASPELNMPHGKKQLSVCDRDAIREWIRQGAKDN
jgi:mono/diheme cytochrome c family protein